jgi:hypothetical protein
MQNNHWSARNGEYLLDLVDDLVMARGVSPLLDAASEAVQNLWREVADYEEAIGKLERQSREVVDEFLVYLDSERTRGQ